MKLISGVVREIQKGPEMGVTVQLLRLSIIPGSCSNRRNDKQSTANVDMEEVMSSQASLDKKIEEELRSKMLLKKQAEVEKQQEFKSLEQLDFDKKKEKLTYT
jgi:hypothetical protein